MKRVLVIAGLCGVAAALWAVWQLSLGSQAREHPGNARAAEALVAGLQAALTQASSLAEPYRCAYLADTPDAPGQEAQGAAQALLGAFTVRRRGPRAWLEPAPSGPMTLGVVADAQGTSRHLPAVRAAFAARGVDLVISLGGMGQTRDELTSVFEALSGPWPVLALPGDTEAIPAHRAACQDQGVLDGAAIRVIHAGSMTLATLPGAPDRTRLWAADQGCVHTAEDMVALAALVAAPGGQDSASGPDRSAEPPHSPRSGEDRPARRPGTHVRVLLAHVPPRQAGPLATDLAAGEIHIGERALADMLAMTRFDLALHGLIVPAHGPRRGARPPGADATVVLSAGAAHGMMDLTGPDQWPHVALIVTIDPARGTMTWERVRP